MSESDDYAVGYKKPPRHTRFRKGCSGNPGGKRRAVATSASSALAHVLAKQVTVSDEDGEARISQLEALMRDLVRKARSGDTRCLKLVLDRLNELEASTPAKLELAGLCQKAARNEAREARAESDNEAAPPQKGAEAASVSATES